MPVVQINLRVAPAIAERLRNLSHATGVKINWLVERAVTEALEAMEAKYEAEHGSPVPVRPDGEEPAQPRKKGKK